MAPFSEFLASNQRLAAFLVDGVVSAMRSMWHESWGRRMEQILRRGRHRPV